jgi:RNA polymerase sigma-70 factor (ECF subfamily)
MALNRSGVGAHRTGVTGAHAAGAVPAATATALIPADVVKRAAAGDKVAFARLVAAYHADLIRIAYVVSGDEQVAQDAAQSAWTIAWRKLGSVRDPAHVRSWLATVAANEARQDLRGRRRETVAEIDLDAGGRPGDPAGEDPAGEIERVDLANALHHLKPEDRALLAMRFVAGFDAAEIAAARGMTASGVRGHLSRVIGRLRKELGDD